MSHEIFPLLKPDISITMLTGVTIPRPLKFLTKLSVCTVQHFIMTLKNDCIICLSYCCAFLRLIGWDRLTGLSPFVIKKGAKKGQKMGDVMTIEI